MTTADQQWAASEREFRQGCTGKERHTSEKAARRVANRPVYRTGGRVEVYRCGHCKSWHLGRQWKWHNQPKRR